MDKILKNKAEYLVESKKAKKFHLESTTEKDAKM